MTTSILVVLIGLFLYTGDTLCNFAEFSLKMNVGVLWETLGTFSVSTNRCQTIKTLIDFRIDEEEIKGSMMFTCNEEQTGLIMTRYSDEYCSNAYIVDRESISMNEEIILLPNLVKIVIKNMECIDNNCMVSSAFGEDCTFSESKYYFNISVPPNQCETLSADIPQAFQQIITNIEEEVIPPEFVYELQESSIKFACCNDYSLMLFNYSDAHCKIASNSMRIPSYYNDKCLDLGGYRRRRTLLHEYIDIIRNDRRGLQSALEAASLVLSWTCDDKIVCTKPFEADLPQECPSHCTDWAWNPVTTSEPAPWVSMGTRNEETIIISIAFISVFILCIFIGFCVLRRKKMSKQVKPIQINNYNINESGNASKYKPMIEDSIEKNANIVVPSSLSSMDNSNIANNAASFENENYITVETLDETNKTINDGI